MKYGIAILATFLYIIGFGQNHSEQIRLISSSRGLSTIDQFEEGRKKQEYRIQIDSTSEYINRTFVSVIQSQSAVLTFTVDTSRFKNGSLVVFNKTKNLKSTVPFQGNRIKLEITGYASDQVIEIKHKGKLLYRIDVISVKSRKEKIWLVPLLKTDLSVDSIQKEINRIYRPTGIHFSIILQKPFLLKNFPEDRLFRNPSEANERYSQEMRYIRNAYLKLHPELKNAHLAFVIPGFKNEKIASYSVKEKTMSFVALNSSRFLAESLAEGLMSDLILENETSKDFIIRSPYWKERNLDQIVYSYFDDYEDIPSSTGIVAFYFWKEDALGNIVLPEKGTKNPLFFISRPYKRNTFSYHLRLDDFWMKTLFSIKRIPFNLLHLLAFIGITWGIVFGGIRLRRWIKLKWHFPRIFRFLSLPMLVAGFVVINYLGFLLVNTAYSLYEVRSGTIDAFYQRSIKNVEIAIQANIHPNKIEEKKLSSELLVQVNNNIELRQRGQVIYFDATLDQNNTIEKLRCTDAKNEIDLPGLKKSINAQNHYFIITYRNEKGERLKDEVYNYLGLDITSALKAKDPIRKILVFVNGYRPTSLGSGFEQHFYDIQKNGFEFPDSYNRLYNFDRYLYWQPWNNIDQRFINVFLPTETYYADGHFSVKTSNYRSIINFSSASSQYPLRCKKGKPHHCYYTSSVKSTLFGANKKKTLGIINYRSNRSGFAKRKRNGRVAGRNLYYALNELPNSSKNDTLFIVAHSMGFAYSLGIIEELRGKINFGSYIIIAPENGKSGMVNPKEWKEIWQYGSNLNSKYPDAPCLQDGVAPQSKVGGLPLDNRVFIPKELYNQKGFFDSHFIGYYTWIFDKKAGEAGYIKKH